MPHVVVMCARLRAAGFGVLSVLHQDTIVEGRVVLTVFDSASFLDILDGSCPISMHARLVPDQSAALP